MNMYTLLGVVAVIYLVISMMNRRKSKGRRSRKFMEDYKRTDDKK